MIFIRMSPDDHHTNQLSAEGKVNFNTSNLLPKGCMSHLIAMLIPKSNRTLMEIAICAIQDTGSFALLLALETQDQHGFSSRYGLTSRALTLDVILLLPNLSFR